MAATMRAALLGCVFVACCTDVPADPATLRWKNGESLPGELIEASAASVTWRASVFTEPFTVSLPVIAGVEFASTEKNDPAQLLRDLETNATKPTDDPWEDPFSIHLRDGSRIFAEITGIDEEAVHIRSARHGEVSLKKREVVSLRKIKAEHLIYSGPNGDANWNAVSKQGKEVPWRSGQAGALVSTSWNRAAFMPLKVPEQAEFRLRLRSSARPEFRFSISAAAGQRVSLETWDDEIVLQGRSFAKVKSLAADDRTLELRLFWDRTSGRSLVYSTSGEKLLETKLEDIDRMKSTRQSDAEKPNTLALTNKGADIQLELLSISAWSGNLPERIKDEGPRILLTDGSTLEGTIVRTMDRKAIAKLADKSQREIDMSGILAVELVPGPTEAKPPQMQLWFADGAFIVGELSRMSGKDVELRTSFTDKPLRSTFAGCRRLVNLGVPPKDTPEAVPLTKMDRVVIGKTTLHGTLDASGGVVPGWLPVGGTKAVPISATEPLEVVRVLPANEALPRAPALVYLNTGEVIPAKLKSIDASGGEIESDVVEQKKLPAGNLRAFQFASQALIDKGFTDPGWRVLRGSAGKFRSDSATINIEPGLSIGHSSMLFGDEIRFSIPKSESYGAVRVRLFSDGRSISTPSMNFLVARFNPQVYCGIETREGQFESQQRLNVPGDKPIDVRFAIGEKVVEAFVNNVSMGKKTVDDKIRSGHGIVIECANIWGNGERQVTIANFASRAAPGRVPLPVVGNDARNEALMVPRFRREDPPKHVLLAANGDLLRGVIEAFAGDYFSFRSGLENIRVPRERVAAAIWLAPPTGSKAEVKGGQGDAGFKPSHWILLTDGARLPVKLEQFTAENAIGTHPQLGRCTVPLSRIFKIRTSAPEPSPAMRELDGWKLQAAPEPVLPEAPGQNSPLLGQEAKDFSLPMLDGKKFSLGENKGKVVVLDFWATWCGPCIRSLPELIAAMDAFDAEKVKFIGVNQAEPAAQVKRFLETRGWSLKVALDGQQSVGRQFGVEGIPHTVIVGPDGKIAWVKTGYDPAGAKEAAEVVKKLLSK